MALIKLNDERVFMAFSTFISLEESVKPKETDYGLNGKNKLWSHKVADHYHTFFSHRPDHHVLVTLNHKTGELAFATHRGEFNTDMHSHYEMTRSNRDDGLTVFNKVLHVGLEGAKKHNMKHLMIKGSDDKLKHVYRGFIQNKFLQTHLKQHGYEYTHSHNNEHHFKKVDTNEK